MRTIKYKAFLIPLYHLISWLLLFLLVGFTRKPEEMHRLTVPQLFVSFLPFNALFYANMYLFVPDYFRNRRLSRYFLSVAASLVVATLLTDVLFYHFRPQSLNPFQVNGFRIVPGLFCLAASFGFGAVRETARIEKERKERETENLRTELSFLRSQVNPHFMLNVINSIVAAARVKPDKVEPALIELAALMSYMLYNNTEEKIPVSEEIGYLESYIKLQMLRFGEDVQLSFNVEKNGSDPCIEPMLLIPLVENAFKHGIGLVEQPVILVSICISAGNEISMKVRNKYNEAALLSEDKNSGIGLSNLKKRLELIYPGRFRLNILKADNWFISSLNLQLT